MESLFEVYLPVVQDINTYGGNFAANLITKSVLNEIDAGAAANDPSCVMLREKILSAIESFKGLHDHQAISTLFEAYYEAVFFLIARARSVVVRTVPAGGVHGKTADFVTEAEPPVQFEVKTIDVYDPARTYARAMAEGLDARLEAEANARSGGGVGSAMRAITPHGPARNRRQAVEQVMKKIDGNIKHDQYAAHSTFLVVALARTSLHSRG